MASTGDTWRLGHRPALDGVRGVAILLVLVGHTLLPAVSRYGPLGVDVFFALSGFLITSLLLEERARTGRTDLAAFYLRRARRLLPALVAFVAVAASVWAVYVGVRQSGTAVASVMLYVANWANIAGVPLGPFGHAWSLAVEEQFYLLWPLTLLVLLRLPRRARAGACGAAVVAVTAWRWYLGHTGADSLWIEQGSIERAAPILLGCALAFFMAGRRDGPAEPRLAVLCLVGLVLVRWVPYTPVFEHLGAGLFATGLIYAVARGDGFAPLQWGPLARVGQLSYGLYLWHFPVVVMFVMVHDLPLAVRMVLWGGAVAVSWGLASLSWRYVETPFLARRSVGGVEPAQDEPDQGVVLAGERLHLGEGLRVRR